jgi:hypothetical protein
VLQHAVCSHSLLPDQHRICRNEVVLRWRHPFVFRGRRFESDGIPDVVVADSLEPTGGIAGVAVLLGAGNGNFLPVVHYATNEYAQFVCIADVNGDGSPDILVASYENDIATPVAKSKC